jgi:cytochrome c oxidase cbb3-type subunit I/II
VTFAEGFTVEAVRPGEGAPLPQHARDLREEPVLKFFAAGITFYGMATFEGPLLSIKSVSGLAHYTDWIIGHVHAGALGWNGFMAAGMFYWLIPKLYGKELYSKRLADVHFWLGTFGILLYVISMWVSGVTQGLMWRALNPDGSLMYPTFVETLLALKPMYWMRLIGGSLYLVGMIMMAYNLAKTMAGAKVVEVEVWVVAPVRQPELAWAKIVFSKPVLITTAVLAIFGLALVANTYTSPLLMLIAFATGVIGAIAVQAAKRGGAPAWHRILEGRALILTVFATIAVLVGGVAELVPALIVKPAEAVSKNEVRPYRALEVEGRDVYIREGCYTCHSQMIRPMRFETLRYGEASTLADSAFDHPFQWGSKRTGPDLAREGGKYPNLWHYRHMVDPRAITAGSNMPPYAHLATATVDLSLTNQKLHALGTVGVPYSSADVDGAQADATAQGQAIAKDLAAEGVKVEPDAQIVALISYLQRLGKPGEAKKPAGAVAAVTDTNGGAK